MSRETLRQTFGEDAELYDRVRPTYPPRLYDDLAALLGNPRRPRVLEIGCGTGQATKPMLKRGWSVKAVELSPELSRVARGNLPELEVITAPFESWPLPAEKFDLVLSATAFHWIDPAVRVPKAADALRPGGVLAIISTHHVAGGSEQLWIDLQECYRRFTDDADEDGPQPADTVPKDSGELDASGRFGPAVFHRYEWERTYSTAEYLDLLSSYSGHRALTSARRDGLYECVSALINAAGGSVTKRHLTQLLVANRLNQPLASS
ncbi:class I SAM-dependent methyltransferase [Kribbella sp. CA-293567]|uniref:class I SAM-dependent methyltransferase n=1 Tax=Kribbella sp. CA-293567 TaxID=3002436 RepID=UPI0022DDD708|nr:class I SAM-dependent methyltransferase [Kribbella sp. CA-293567]WBQ03057.1 methyltransferase domain-containing protein [Kribbella sp. CA-293567]